MIELDMLQILMERTIEAILNILAYNFVFYLIYFLERSIHS